MRRTSEYENFFARFGITGAVAYEVTDPRCEVDVLRREFRDLLRKFFDRSFDTADPMVTNFRSSRCGSSGICGGPAS